jgi:alpha-glucosidase
MEGTVPLTAPERETTATQPPETLDQGVYYQIYPRSWADADGDGVGDLRGITAHLDHLQWLGVDGIWLDPVMPSPNADWGYDVADYCAVHPDLGTLADVDELLRQAHRRGIRVLFDLVPNHTSDQHPWFLEARASRASRRRAWYVWADPDADGAPPNNWSAALFGGPAWAWDEPSGQYYLHSFLPQQADLDWRNEEVRAAFDDIVRFWFERGVDGFRIDVVPALIVDRELRDNPPGRPGDPPELVMGGHLLVHNINQPEVHDVVRRWRALAAAYTPPRVLAGETFLFDLREVARYFGSGDELQIAFNFPFTLAPFRAPELAAVVAATEQAFPAWAWPAWTGSNHDAGRLASRWCGDDLQRVKMALTLLLTLRGTPFLYYGDELGMTDADVPFERRLDPAGLIDRAEPGRDRCRTPMQWSDGAGRGFTSAADPWLPFGGHAERNVARERRDEASPLILTRELTGLRRRSADVRCGAYRQIVARDGLWAWQRGRGTVVALNMGDAPARLPAAGLPAARLRAAVATDVERRGAVLEGDIELRAWEALVLEALP